MLAIEGGGERGARIDDPDGVSNPNPSGICVL
jgi:hypothetical protein